MSVGPDQHDPGAPATVSHVAGDPAILRARRVATPVGGAESAPVAAAEAPAVPAVVASPEGAHVVAPVAVPLGGVAAPPVAGG